MRRTIPRRPWALGALVAIAVLALIIHPLGAAPTKKKKKSIPPKVQETVGDIAFVVSIGEMRVEGVGLVTGLDNTGVDPPPSSYRKELRRRDDQGRTSRSPSGCWPTLRSPW